MIDTMRGIAPANASWVTVQPERFEGGVPADVELKTVSGGDLPTLMRDGEIDAFLLQGGRPLPEEFAELTVPAYPDLVSAKRDYYRADGVLPLMHVTVVKEELAKAQPSLVPALLAAYRHATDLAAADPTTEWPLPPLGHGLDEMRELLGGDPWPYGVAVISDVLAAAGCPLVHLESTGSEVFHDAGMASGPTRLGAMATAERTAIFDEAWPVWGIKALEQGLTFLCLRESTLEPPRAMGYRTMTITPEIAPGLTRKIKVIDFSGWPVSVTPGPATTSSSGSAPRSTSGVTSSRGLGPNHFRWSGCVATTWMRHSTYRSIRRRDAAGKPRATSERRFSGTRHHQCKGDRQ